MVIISSPHYVSSLLLVALLLGGSRNPGAQGQARQEMPTVRPAAQLLPPSPGYRLPDGETYVYSVEWHMFNAGLARVSLDQSGNQQRVTAIADSLGAVNLMYPVHDRFQSFFDPRSFCSEEIVRHSEEGKRRRDSEVRFEYQRHKAVRNDKDLKTGDSKRLESDIPGCVTDVVSGFYYLASQALTPGTLYTFPISDGRKTTDISARVETTERVKVPAGTYPSLRLAAEPISGPLKGKAKISVWFSNDRKHTPVQLRAKLGWGTLLFRLQRWERK